MSKRGKTKGGQYERKIATSLGEWFYGDETALWRVGGSGARATRRQAAGRSCVHPGDIVPVQPAAMNFPLAVECKNHQGWSFDQLLKPTVNAPRLLLWWDKVYLEALNVSLVPWLVFTKNGLPDYVLCDGRGLHPAYDRICLEFHYAFKAKSHRGSLFVVPLSELQDHRLAGRRYLQHLERQCRGR